MGRDTARFRIRGGSGGFTWVVARENCARYAARQAGCGVLVELSSTKANRLVPLVAPWTVELDHLDQECGLANADDVHRPGIDELAVAFEPHAVAVSAGILFRFFTLAQLAPYARKGLPNIGFGCNSAQRE